MKYKETCGWFGEGRGACLLQPGHKNDHTCEEDGRLLKAADKHIQLAIDLCATQAEDEGLWFIAATAPEAYLQQELRKLHGVIERGKKGTSEPRS